jgi:hypothetical protein
MTTVVSMAAQFTDVSLDDMRTFLKRAFHALEPQKEENVRGELVINLPLSKRVAIKVFTSVSAGREQAAGVGADAIRVGIYRDGRPLKSGKWPIVKRTQGWKENLRERVEDMMEKYDSLEADIEGGKYITWE